MGEIAESLINGEFDYITGEYLGEGVGYPRTHAYGRRNALPIIKKPGEYMYLKYVQGQRL